MRPGDEMLKYEFTEETRLFAGRVLHRIVAVEDLPCSGIRKGDLGGFIEAEHNSIKFEGAQQC